MLAVQQLQWNTQNFLRASALLRCYRRKYVLVQEAEPLDVVSSWLAGVEYLRKWCARAAHRGSLKKFACECVWRGKTSARLSAVYKSCLNTLKDNDRSFKLYNSIKLFSIKRTGPPTARQTRLTIRTFTKITDHRERRRVTVVAPGF